MTKWVIDQLRAIDLERGKQALAEADAHEEQGGLDGYIAIAEELGDIKPLRELLTELLPMLAWTPVQAQALKYIAEHFLHLPKRRRGQRYRKTFRDTAVSDAVGDIKRIRELWRQHYDGKRNRGNSLISAEAIAAKRHGVTVDQILNRQKHRTKS
jgi:hypothetical protein